MGNKDGPNQQLPEGKRVGASHVLPAGSVKEVNDQRAKDQSKDKLNVHLLVAL